MSINCIDSYKILMSNIWNLYHLSKQLRWTFFIYSDGLTETIGESGTQTIGELIVEDDTYIMQLKHKYKMAKIKQYRLKQSMSLLAYCIDSIRIGATIIILIKNKANITFNDRQSDLTTVYHKPNTLLYKEIYFKKWNHDRYRSKTCGKLFSPWQLLHSQQTQSVQHLRYLNLLQTI